MTTFNAIFTSPEIQTKLEKYPHLKMAYEEVEDFLGWSNNDNDTTRLNKIKLGLLKHIQKIYDNGKNQETTNTVTFVDVNNNNLVTRYCGNDVTFDITPSGTLIISNFTENQPQLNLFGGTKQSCVNGTVAYNNSQWSMVSKIFLEASKKDGI